jgi:putative endonuclease
MAQLELTVDSTKAVVGIKPLEEQLTLLLGKAEALQRALFFQGKAPGGADQLMKDAKKRIDQTTKAEEAAKNKGKAEINARIVANSLAADLAAIQKQINLAGPLKIKAVVETVTHKGGTPVPPTSTQKASSSTITSAKELAKAKASMAAAEAKAAQDYGVYVLRNQKGQTYIGQTNDLAKRLKDHNAGNGAKYTKSLLRKGGGDFEIIGWSGGGLTEADAMKLEKQAKASKKIKQQLIDIYNNPKEFFAEEPAAKSAPKTKTRKTLKEELREYNKADGPGEFFPGENLDYSESIPEASPEEKLKVAKRLAEAERRAKLLAGASTPKRKAKGVNPVGYTVGQHAGYGPGGRGDTTAFIPFAKSEFNNPKFESISNALYKAWDSIYKKNPGTSKFEGEERLRLLKEGMLKRGRSGEGDVGQALQQLVKLSNSQQGLHIAHFKTKPNMQDMADTHEVKAKLLGEVLQTLGAKPHGATQGEPGGWFAEKSPPGMTDETREKLARMRARLLDDRRGEGGWMDQWGGSQEKSNQKQNEMAAAAAAANKKQRDEQLKSAEEEIIKSTKARAKIEGQNMNIADKTLSDRAAMREAQKNGWKKQLELAASRGELDSAKHYQTFKKDGGADKWAAKQKEIYRGLYEEKNPEVYKGLMADLQKKANLVRAAEKKNAEVIASKAAEGAIEGATTPQATVQRVKGAAKATAEQAVKQAVAAAAAPAASNADEADALLARIADMKLGTRGRGQWEAVHALETKATKLKGDKKFFDDKEPGRYSAEVKKINNELDVMSGKFNKLNGTGGGGGGGGGGGLANGFFAKWSLYMSGIAATLFVLQQATSYMNALVGAGQGYEDTLRKMAAAAGMTADQMGRLDASFVSIMNSQGYAQSDLAGYGQELLILGVSYEDLGSAMERAAKIAEATGMKPADAAAAAIDKVYGLTNAYLDQSKMLEGTLDKAMSRTSAGITTMLTAWYRSKEPDLIKFFDKISAWVSANEPKIVKTINVFMSGLTGIAEVLGFIIDKLTSLIDLLDKLDIGKALLVGGGIAMGSRMIGGKIAAYGAGKVAAGSASKIGGLAVGVGGMMGPVGLGVGTAAMLIEMANEKHREKIKDAIETADPSERLKKLQGLQSLAGLHASKPKGYGDLESSQQMGERGWIEPAATEFVEATDEASAELKLLAQAIRETNLEIASGKKKVGEEPTEADKFAKKNSYMPLTASEMETFAADIFAKTGMTESYAEVLQSKINETQSKLTRAQDTGGNVAPKIMAETQAYLDQLEFEKWRTLSGPKVGAMGQLAQTFGGDFEMGGERYSEMLKKIIANDIAKMGFNEGNEGERNAAERLRESKEFQSNQQIIAPTMGFYEELFTLSGKTNQKFWDNELLKATQKADELATSTEERDRFVERSKWALKERKREPQVRALESIQAETGQAPAALLEILRERQKMQSETDWNQDWVKNNLDAQEMLNKKHAIEIRKIDMLAYEGRLDAAKEFFEETGILTESYQDLEIKSLNDHHANLIASGRYNEDELEKLYKYRLENLRNKFIQPQVEAYQDMYSELGIMSDKLYEIELQRIDEAAQRIKDITGDEALAEQYAKSRKDKTDIKKITGTPGWGNFEDIPSAIRKTFEVDQETAAKRVTDIWVDAINDIEGTWKESFFDIMEGRFKNFEDLATKTAKTIQRALNEVAWEFLKDQVLKPAINSGGVLDSIFGNFGVSKKPEFGGVVNEDHNPIESVMEEAAGVFDGIVNEDHNPLDLAMQAMGLGSNAESQAVATMNVDLMNVKGVMGAGGIGGGLAGSAGSGGTDWLGTIVGAIGSYYGGSEAGEPEQLGQYYANGGWINEPVVGRGKLTGNKYVIGENGSEFVGNIQNMAKIAQAAGTGNAAPVTVHVHIQGESNMSRQSVSQLQAAVGTAVARASRRNS